MDEVGSAGSQQFYYAMVLLYRFCFLSRRDNYEKRSVLSATIHPDIKRTLNDISDRTGMNVSQVTDEVLFKGLIKMQELPEPVE